jgi:hypothetical protein
MRRLVAPTLAIIAFAAAAPRAYAQTGEPRGFFVGIGAGAALVSEPAIDFSRLGGSLHARAGWRLSPSTALLLEGSMTGLGSDRTDSVEIVGLDETFMLPVPRTLRTQTLLASVQLATPGGAYLRPGVGLARHGERFLRPGPADGVVEATGWKSSVAAAVAVGHQAAIPGFPLDLEGIVGWSGGADGTGQRWTAGLQITRIIHF